MDNKYTMHVVSHTHWDREWWSTFQHFRMRLVDFMDELINLLESDPEYRYFHLDGQTIMLEDYLAIRPEKEQTLRELVKQGRILIGPWYNQPDEFLVSGEGLIRNLMLGRKIGEDWGNWMAVGYVPDCFGHISQFPQIMRGFGIDSAVLFRGITTDQVNSEFVWRSPDGSSVLCIKLPDNNAYSNWFYRLRNTITSDSKPQFADLDPEQFRREVAELIADCVKEKPTTSHLLFMDGVDQIFASPVLSAIIRDINENTDLGRMLHSTLPDFIAAVRAENPVLQEVEGELRCGNRDWKLQSVLPNVLSSRIHLKQAMREMETLLEKWAEPFSTVAWLLGKEYPSAFLALAWNYVLKNHPHDSICGCSIDQVHKDMVYRFDQARLITQPIVQQSLSYIAEKVDTSSGAKTRGDGDAGTVALVVFNPLSWERSEVVEAEVNLPHDWNVRGLSVTDDEGNEVPFGVTESRGGAIFEQARYDIPKHTPTWYRRIAVQVEKVPSTGYRTYYVHALGKPNRIPGSLLISHTQAENEYLSVGVNTNGSICICAKEEGMPCVFEGMIFEDGGDFGDGYYYRKPAEDRVVLSTACPAVVSVTEDTPVRATFRVDTTMTIPASAHPNGRQRSGETVDLRITSYVSLAKGSRRVDIITEVENNARDHRLRVLFPADLYAEFSHAEQAFDVVCRPIRNPEQRDWREPHPSQHPQKSFVDVSDGSAGVCIINEGLPEYEVMDDDTRTIALTLMRSTGNGVGGPENQKEGQLIGTHRFRYSVYLHKGDWEEAKVWQQGWEHNVPMLAIQSDIHDGELPLSKSFLSVGDERVLLSALKKAERSDELIARVYNIGTEEVTCPMKIQGVHDLRLTDMNEQPVGAEPLQDTLRIGPKKIITLAGRKGV